MNLVCKDHYFPVSHVDFVGVVIGKLNNYQRYLITTLKIYGHNNDPIHARFPARPIFSNRMCNKMV